MKRRVMPSTGAKFFLGLALTISSTPAATKHVSIKDPIFGFNFDNGKYTFEKLPAKILEACPVLVTPLWGRESWIFARATGDSDDYIIIGGIFVKHNDKSFEKKFEPDSKGAVVHINGHNCTLVGPADEFFETKQKNINSRLLSRLSKDLKERYYIAFGDEKRFRRLLKQLRSSRADNIFKNIESFAD